LNTCFVIIVVLTGLASGRDHSVMERKAEIKVWICSCMPQSGITDRLARNYLGRSKTIQTAFPCFEGNRRMQLLEKISVEIGQLADYLAVADE
jgi:hypothetical protein